MFVSKYGKENVYYCKCKTCGSEIGYYKNEELNNIYDYFGTVVCETYIYCPVCHNKIVIDVEGV